MHRRALPLLITAVLAAAATSCRGPADSTETRVALLGTGTPNPDPDRSGCSVAVIVKGVPYIVDFGPGLVRRAAGLAPSHGGKISALEANYLTRAFLTHLHSDHTAGYPDLILTPWVQGRKEPLSVWGPEGLAEMTGHILEAYQEDIRYRLYGGEPSNDRGWRVNVHEIQEGEIYSDERVKVEAFLVQHGTWPNAYGFRFTSPDRVIVISGDTRPCENVEKFASGADLLIHEAYCVRTYGRRPENWKAYHATHHTSTVELGELAARAKPKRVVIYHVLAWGASDEEMVREVKSKFSGQVAVGRDLQIY